MLFDHIIDKYANGISLMDLIKNQQILDKLPKMYVPEVEMYDGGGIFVSNGSSVFVKETGPVKVRFMLFDMKGHRITEPGLAYTQFNPKRAKYLARFSCSAIGLSGPNLKMDYVVDIDSIKLQPVGEMYSQDHVKDDHTRVRQIIEDYRYQFLSTDMGYDADPYLTKFDMCSAEIIDQYFK